MRNKIYLFLLLLLSASTSLFAQQEAQFSQFMFNKLSFNPGFAGNDQKICFTGFARQQWMGFTDANGDKTAPQTFLASLDACLNFSNKTNFWSRSGIGLVVSQDKLGYEATTTVRISYAYHINVGAGKLGIGAQIGFLDKKIDFTKFVAIQPDDPLLGNKAKQSNMFTDYAFGLYYQLPGKFYVGMSALNLSEPKGFPWTGSSNGNTVSGNAYSLDRTYYLTGGYEYVFPSDPSFELDPQMIVKTDFKSAQYDIAAILKYNNKVWGGLSYRVQDAITVILGWSPIPAWSFGYSYDITTSNMGGAGKSSGSHEIFAKYCFNISFPTYVKSYRNTRWL
ncbi:MAG: type IX secretion system membrane protein PorP/SprF [Bacteroidota bacterium]